jgi:hypothetical protein
MNVYSDFIIPTFGRHVTILYKKKEFNVCEDKMSGVNEMFSIFFSTDLLKLINLLRFNI